MIFLMTNNKFCGDSTISGFSPNGVGNSPGKSWDAPHYIDIAKATAVG